ncbi:MAG: hypothetical protein IOD12_05075, partial [Silvanigrellales bacterium]|nr:hypothetical protein [Silvanigrellales bacterium]
CVLVGAACKDPGAASTCVKADIAPGVGKIVNDGRAGFVQFEYLPATPGSAPSSHAVQTQCTALFDMPGSGASNRILRLWTAAHCVGRNPSGIQRITAFVHSKAGLLEVPLTLAAPETHGKTANGGTCYEAALAQGAGVSSGTQSACFSWSDLLVVDAVVAAEEWAAFTSLVRLPDFRTIATPEVSTFFDARDALAKLENADLAGRPLSEARALVEQSWLPLARRLKTAPASAVVITSSKRDSDFRAVALNEFVPHPDETTHTMLPFGFRVSSQFSRLKVKFEKGDSGSILTLDGVLPLLALHSVDGEETSGGASVVALPSRRPSRANETIESNKKTTSNERNTPKEHDCTKGT